MGNQAAHGQAAGGIHADAAPCHQHVDAADIFNLAEGGSQRQTQRIKSPIAQPQRRGSQVNRNNTAAELNRVRSVQGQFRLSAQAVHLVVGRVAQQLPADCFHLFRPQDSRNGRHMLRHQVQSVLRGQVQGPQAFRLRQAVPVGRVPLQRGHSRGRNLLIGILRRVPGAAGQSGGDQGQRDRQAQQFFPSHAVSAPLSPLGSVTMKQLPLPGSLSTRICPPCIVTSWRTMLSPSPVPPVSRLRALSTR